MKVPLKVAEQGLLLHQQRLILLARIKRLYETKVPASTFMTSDEVSAIKELNGRIDDFERGITT
jgi:hypothetical protein